MDKPIFNDNSFGNHTCELIFKTNETPEDRRDIKAECNNGKQCIDMVVENLRNILFLNLVPSEMRDYSRINGSELRPKADNLSSVLYKLCQDGVNKKTILNVIGKLPENEVLDIDFIKTLNEID